MPFQQNGLKEKSNLKEAQMRQICKVMSVSNLDEIVVLANGHTNQGMFKLLACRYFRKIYSF